MTYKPTRKFTADVGMESVDTTLSGPDTLEKDLDIINKMFDPMATHDDASSGGIGEGNVQNDSISTDKMQDNAVTDPKIGDRTLNDSIADPIADMGKITQLFSWIGKMIKGITGEASWKTTPTISIKSLKSNYDGHRTQATMDHPDNSVTDSKIGNRTLNDSIADTISNTGKATQLFSWIGKVIKGITGEVDWKTPPTIDIKTFKSNYDSFNTAYTNHKSANVLDHPDQSVTTAKLKDGNVTDIKIGNRTIPLQPTANVNTGKLTELLETLAYILHNTHGGTNFNTIPSKTLTQVIADITDLLGLGRTTETIKGNRDLIEGLESSKFDKKGGIITGDTTIGNASLNLLRNIVGKELGFYFDVVEDNYVPILNITHKKSEYIEQVIFTIDKNGNFILDGKLYTETNNEVWTTGNFDPDTKADQVTTYNKTEVDTAIQNAKDQVLLDIDRKEPVNIVDDLDTTYPTPDIGWKVFVKAIYTQDFLASSGLQTIVTDNIVYDDATTLKYYKAKSDLGSIDLSIEDFTNTTNWTDISATRGNYTCVAVSPISWAKDSDTIPLADENTDGQMSHENFSKLKGIDDNANNYVHDSTHSADMITETSQKLWMNPTERTNLSDLYADFYSLPIEEYLENVKKDYESIPIKSGDFSYIDVNHNLNSYPIPKCRVDNAFGIGGFGLIGFGDVTEMLITPVEVEYLSENKARIWFDEDLSMCDMKIRFA